MNIWLEGLRVAAVGMGVVFTGLVLLIVLISLTRAFSGSGEEQKPKAAPLKAPPAPAPAAPVFQEEDPQVVAAITAALAAMYQEQPQPVSGFVVRRIRRS